MARPTILPSQIAFLELLLAMFFRRRANRRSDGASNWNRVGEANRVDDGVRSLRKLDRRSDRDRVPASYAVRTQNKRLPSRLLSHEIFGRIADRTVDEGRKVCRNAKPPEGRRKFATRRRQSSQGLDAFVEVNDERLIQKLRMGFATRSDVLAAACS